MKTVFTHTGKTYAVSTAAGCTVSAAGTTLCICEAGQQVAFVAPSGEVECSDDGAFLTPVDGGGGPSSSGGDGGAEKAIDFTTLAEAVDAAKKHIADAELHLKEGEREKILGAASKDELQSLREELEHEAERAVQYKGSVANFDALPVDEQKVGDMWNVEDTGANFIWDGEKWDDAAPMLGGFALKVDVEKEIEEATMKEGVVELTTGDGASDFNARYLQLGSRYVRAGKLRAVTLTCRAGANNEIAMEALYLGVWEKNEADDGYTRLGASSAAEAQVVGQAKEWQFDDLPISGRPLRFAFLTEAEGVWPSDWKLFGVRVFARDGGDAESKIVGKNGGDNAFVAVATLSVLAPGVEPRFAAAEHAADAVAHLTQEEHEGLTGLLENPPQDGADGAPGKDAELTAEQTEALQFIIDNKSALEQLIAAQS